MIGTNLKRNIMSENNSPKPPKKFVSLHNHTGFSAFDGLGYPEDHFKWCLDNGLDAHAITEHGHFSSYAHAQLWVESWKKSNKEKTFKYIPGIEAYFHPDLKQWAIDKEIADQAAIDRKAAKKLKDQQAKLQTKLVMEVDKSDETENIEMSNTLTVEDEDESKSTKLFNPVNRRHHLVLLPKNQRGLQKLFAAASEGFLRGFYRFPRIDTAVLREAAKGGDIIASSACLGGLLSYNVLNELQNHKFDNLSQHLLDDPSILERCITAIGNSYDLMTQCLGEGNYFLELQFNKLPAQNLVNRAIIEFARRNGVTNQLIVTCDAHYYNPDVWKERELYKKLGFMNYKAYSPDSLPKSKEELKCELYPKNATQVWEEYLRSKVDTSFYDDDIVRAAIERTHDIAHTVIEEIKPDRSPKFPTEKLVPQGTKSFNHLVSLCKVGLVKRGLANRKEYVDRLMEELGVIKQMNNADYFISYQKIMELARSVTMCGPARGSGGGSLVAYVLYITDLDPLRWDLPFARFLSVYRQGAPDIDCVHEDHLVLIHGAPPRRIKDVKEGDYLIGGDGQPHMVTAVYHRQLRDNEKPLSFTVKADDGMLGHINVVPRHKFVKEDGSVVYANELRIGDSLMASCSVNIESILECDLTNEQHKYVDVTVADDHRFHIIPFDVIDDGDKTVLTFSYEGSF